MNVKPFTLTDNVSDQLLMVTDRGVEGVSLVVTAASTFGSGTLTIKARPVNSSIDPETLDASTTIAAGHQKAYYVGAGMEVFINLSGATSPSIEGWVAPIGG